MMKRAFHPILVIAAALLLAAGTPTEPATEDAVQIPTPDDWQDLGIIFEAGSQGDWDLFLAGGFAGSAVKKKGIYYLYYQGASGYREVDETVTGRAIGVAVSLDGINFVKHSGNPVVQWQPNGNGEEGAVSSAVYRDDRKRIVLFYGANTEESATTVNADGRLAVSKNGLTFKNKGRVLNHSQSGLWGSGDEIFPIASFQASDRSWYVYYIPNGTSQSRRLGVAWGPGRKKLNASGPVRSEGAQVSAWGMGGTAKIGTDRFALFLNDVQRSRMEARLVSADDPTRVTAPVARYRFPDFAQGTVLLDRKTSTWFLYYRNRDQTAWGVKVAPAGPRDATAPLAPASLEVIRTDPHLVMLSWDPALDSDTGVARYEIYRDHQLRGTTTGPSFLDRLDTTEGTVTYEIVPVNLHGTRAVTGTTIDLEASDIPLTSQQR